MPLQHLRASVANKRPAPSGMSDGQLAINTNDASPGLFFKNAGGTLVKIGPVHVGTTAPNATPASGGTSGNTTGELWLDSTGGDYALKTWDGSAWQSTVVTSGMIKDGTISNADINASAGIVYSKLTLSSGIVDADISASAAISLSKLATGALPTGITIASGNIVDGTIINADVNASAAIAGTKISPDFGSQNIITTGGLQAANFNGGALAGFRNAVINGNFDIWQRGTSFSPANNTYTADRWVVVYDGSGATRTISREIFIPGSTEAAPGATFFLGFNQTVAGSGGTYNGLVQRIEDVRTFGGQTITLSFYARGVSAALTLPVIGLSQAFGVGGSATVFTTVASNVVIEGTNFAKYTYTVTLPSITGKTIGTGSHLSLEFVTPNNAIFNFQIASVQLELGPVATPFERRIYGQELALCQRYFQYADGLMAGYATGGGVTAAYRSTSLVQMRATPTVSITSSSNVGCTGSAIQAVGTGHWEFTCVATGAFIGAAVATLSAEL